MKYKYFLLLCLAIYSTNIFAQNNAVQVDSLDILYKELPEVIIEGERPIAKIEQGRLTYQMPLLLQKIPANNAYDALTKIPGVYVQSDNIFFANKPVTIIINNRVSSMSYADIVGMLKVMPPERLAKAELMLTAPANLHVRGAVINLITKEYMDSLDGKLSEAAPNLNVIPKDYKGDRHISGQLLGSYNQSKYGSENIAANLLMTAPKLTIDANYSLTNGKNYSEAEHKALHPLSTGLVEYADFTKNETSGTHHSYRIGVDYLFNKDHLLSVAYNGSYYNFHSHNHTTGNSISEQNTKGHSMLNNVDINYTVPFGLKLSASYLGYRSPKNQDLNGTLELENKNYTSYSNQQIDKFMFTADQSHQLKKNWTLMYGAQAQFANNNSFQTTLDGHGAELPEASSQVDIDERIINAYAGFSKQFNENISFDASVTVENYHAPKWNDWRAYPEFNFLWSVNSHHLLNLSLSSNATYPSYWSTMSAINYNTTYTEIWGNPDLKPTSDYNISFMWQINRKYSITAFADLKPNFSVQLPYQPSDRMAVIMKEVNFDHRNSFGLQANAQFSWGSWLNGNVFVMGEYTNDKCHNFFDLAFDRSKFVCIAGGNASIALSKKHHLNMTLNPFFQSNSIQGVYDIKSIFRLNASMRWTSNNAKWSVILSGNNITNNSFRTQSVYGNQNFMMKVNQSWATASLTCVYRFGNYKKKETKEIDTSRIGH